MKRMDLIFPSLILVSLFSFAQISRAQSPQKTADIRFFETRIRPLLANRCYRCHGEKKQRGDLRVDSPASLKKGGASGSAVVIPGQPEKSLLIQAVRHLNDDLRMPPGKKLTKQEIADLAHWVKTGALFPDSGKVAKNQGSQHWAFQPPQDPPVPDVKDKTWPQSPLDHFVLAELEAKGLRPAPAADNRTLIRRATFDLIGLPPTPEEVEAFLQDSSPDAFAKVVDRLLASPHYGERWGRHWLDVARYADSNGLDENVAYGNAWRYRDYVVAAFNEDKPYNQFLVEQMAGDLLPAADEKTRHEQLIATGFLALGPKVLAEVDEKKMEMDILDEQIDTLGRAFMGLTVGCARCHNHKFDPITMQDYYGLVGIFQSTKTMEHFKKIARWHENSLATKEDLARKKAHDEKIARKKAEIAQFVRQANEQVKTNLKPGQSVPKKLETLYSAETLAELKKLREQLDHLKKTVPELPTAMGVTDGKITQAVLLKRGNHLTPGPRVPRRFPEFLVDDQPAFELQQSGRLELARWLVSDNHPLTSRVMVNRIWRWHFGQGLVRSTDNFGRLGESPTNQALLDWLAHRFQENGWSMKKMHRLIMLSSTYQMSSRFDAESAQIAPDNRLYWRFNLRRLEAEAIRDNILAVSGLLDKSMGGPVLHVKNREFIFNHTSKDLTKYDSLRRSLYLPVIRNNLYDVYQLFDATDATVSNGNRATTTVATQALFMMNSDLVAQATDNLAKILLNRTDLDDKGRMQLLYMKAYGRPPSEREVDRNLAAVGRFEKAWQKTGGSVEECRERAWALLCHVVLSANEFVYVR